MREATYAVALFLAVAVQTAVAPLFRLGGAEASVVMLFVMVVLMLEGPRPAMVAAPIAALLYAFAAGITPALVLIGFVPLVMIGAWVEDLRWPVARFALVATTFLAATAILRLVLALGAVVQGADAAFWILFSRVLLPGMVIDLALLAVAYAPIRIGRIELREMSLATMRY
jgi:hypothetical protein